MDLRMRLRAATPARVALGRVGSALPTGPMLGFQLAHARARDAVHAALAPGEFGETVAGLRSIEVHSRAVDRALYLRRPDLGRRLDPADVARLTNTGDEVAVVIADGLSATALRTHGETLVSAVVERLKGWRVAPIVVAHQARVAIGDEIGAALGVDLVIVLIGERPGLSAADSVGAYITWAPRAGRRDSERNCISNIRPPHGLSIAEAADSIVAIANAARAHQLTGVLLKNSEAHALLPPPAADGSII
jgi:ethanolamine ammonia-lyase small subunit